MLKPVRIKHKNQKAKDLNIFQNNKIRTYSQKTESTELNKQQVNKTQKNISLHERQVYSGETFYESISQSQISPFLQIQIENHLSSPSVEVQKSNGKSSPDTSQLLRRVTKINRSKHLGPEYSIKFSKQRKQSFLSNPDYNIVQQRFPIFMNNNKSCSNYENLDSAKNQSYEIQKQYNKAFNSLNDEIKTEVEDSDLYNSIINAQRTSTIQRPKQEPLSLAKYLFDRDIKDDLKKLINMRKESYEGQVQYLNRNSRVKPGQLQLRSMTTALREIKPAFQIVQNQLIKLKPLKEQNKDAFFNITKSLIY